MDPAWVGFIIYLIVVLLVGFATVRLTKTLDDFLIAGRKLGPWVVAISERASGESAWLLVGLPGVAWASGFAALWPAIGCTFGILFSWAFIAHRLRAQSEQLGAITLPDFLESRLGDDSRLIRVVSTIIILIFFTMYVAAQLIGAGKVFNVTFGIDPIWGMIIGGAIIIFYTVMGGFFAVAWTDLFQGLLMVATLVILPVVSVIELGGFGAFIDKVNSVNPSLLTVTEGKTGAAMWATIIGGLAIGLGYMGQPHLVVRFMAIRSAHDLKRGSLIAVVWSILAFWGAVLIGVLGLALYSSGLSDAEQIMPHMVRELIPAWLAGIFISGAIAAMMSTADSQLLVSTSAVAEDVYHRMLNRRASQRQLVWLSRIATIVIGGIAYLLAFTAEDTVYGFVLYAWAGLAASFGPGLLLTLWWKRTTKWGVLAGMISGTLIVILWKSVLKLSDRLYELAPAFFVALALVIFVSLVTRPAARRAASAD